MDAIPAVELDDQSWSVLVASVEGVENAWQAATPPHLASFLPAESAAFRQRVLVELVKVDQEYRWKSGERRTLETYLAEWPELQAAPETVVELLSAECLTRAIFDTLPTRAELSARFPDASPSIDLAAIETIAQQERGTRLDGVEPRLDGPDTRHVVADETPSKITIPQSPALSGRFGRYEIRGLLGRGGMGAVYRAYDSQLQREVALKIPRFDANSEPDTLERFVREARAAGSIRHPNICPIYDAGQIDDIYYIAMALVEGVSLAQEIKTQPIDPQEAARIVAKLAGAVHKAHTAGIIHRDIKPSNVMIDDMGEPVLMDFGLARQMFNAESITHAGALLGTPAYMSPEQIGGESQAVDARTDVYGLGVLLYHLLTGELPFSSPLPRLFVEIEESDPTLPRRLRPEIDRVLEAICLKAMAKRSTDRYQSADDLAGALNGYLRGLPQSGNVPPRRRVVRWLAALAGAGLFVLLAVLLHIQMGDGTLVLEVTEPDVQVTIDNVQQDVEIRSPRDRIEIRLARGKHQLEVTKDGFTAFTEEFTVARGGKTELHARLLARPSGPGTATPPQRPGADAQTLLRAWPAASPLPPDATKPLTRAALVTQPAKLEGVKAWTLETRGHRGAVYSIASDPKGRYVASGGEDGTIRVWDAKDWRLVAVLAGHDAPVTDLAWSPNGEMLASGSWYGACLWGMVPPRLLERIGSFGTPNACPLAWAPDSMRLALRPDWSLDRVQIWDCRQRKQIGKSLEAPQRADGRQIAIESLSWSPDGQKLAGTVGEGLIKGAGNVLVWDVNSGKLLQNWQNAVRNDNTCILWLPDSRRVITAGYDVSACYHDLGDPKPAKPLPLGIEPVVCILSKEGRLAAGDATGRVVVADAQNGTVVSRFPVLAKLPKYRWWAYEESPALPLDWSADGKTLLVGSPDGGIERWDPVNGKMVGKFSGQPGTVQSSNWFPASHRLFLSSEDHIFLLDAGLQRLPAVVPLPGKPMRGNYRLSPNLVYALLPAVAPSPDGQMLIYRTEGGNLHCWSISQNRSLASFPCPFVDDPCVYWAPDGQAVLLGVFGERYFVVRGLTQGAPKAQVLEGSEEIAHPPAWSPDARVVAAVDKSRRLHLWNVITGQTLRLIQESLDPTDGAIISFSPDSALLAVKDGGFFFRVADVAQDRFLGRYQTGADHCRVLSWSANGRHLVVSGGGGFQNEGNVRLFDTASWKLEHTFRGPLTLTSAISWSADNRIISASAVTNTVYRWDVDTHVQLGLREGHLRHVSEIRYWPEGDIVASLAEGGAVHLWKPSTGEPLRAFVFLKGLEPVAISPQGHYLARDDVDKELVYVVEIAGGEQLTLSPADFATRYGWKNDPERLPASLDAK
jgi:WD40 repeat protein